jgi:radical SAM enzyme (rSAM/lipoprotein system)
MPLKLTLRKRTALELFRRIRKNRVKLHELRVLFWECTLRCNAACRHCGSDCRVSTTHPDMPAKDFLNLIDDITPFVNPNKLMIVFTGGEALLRPDIEQCGSELCRRGYPWGIVSNGLLFGQRLDSLLAAGLHSATVSLDGFEKAHNWLRGRSNSFKMAVRAIERLANSNIIVWDVVTCVNQKNFDDLPQFRQFLTSIGVKNWRIFTIFPSGRAARTPELQLDDRQFTQLMDFICDCRREGFHVSYGCEGFLGNYEMEVRDNFYQCNAGINTASVLIDGSITGCTSIRANFHQGNIYKDRFVDVWEQRFQPFRDRSWTRKGQCADCSMFRYCEGNGMHLYNDNAELQICHYMKLKAKN